MIREKELGLTFIHCVPAMTSLTCSYAGPKHFDWDGGVRVYWESTADCIKIHCERPVSIYLDENNAIVIRAVGK